MTPLGANVLLEPINQIDMPGYFLSSFETCAKLVVDAASAHVRMQFDAYHCARIAGDVPAELRRWLPLVGHLQIASAPDRAEPDHGDVDYGELFALLAELGYEGDIGCEYHPANGTLSGLGWIQHHRQKQERQAAAERRAANG